MSTKIDRTVTCGVCETTSTMLVLLSSSLFGVPDLDNRPPPMARFDNDMYVQCCPNCGYCAENLQAPAPRNARFVVASQRYKEVLGSDPPPAAYRQFLCAAKIVEASGDWFNATWYAARAAWSCDDKGARDAAAACRLNAVTLGRRALESGQPLVPENGSRLILADFLRRAGQFEEALDECHRALADLRDSMLGRFVEFEIRLARARDMEAHSVEELHPPTRTLPPAASELLSKR